jgi:hypothetical protein
MREFKEDSTTLNFSTTSRLFAALFKTCRHDALRVESSEWQISSNTSVIWLNEEIGVEICHGYDAVDLQNPRHTDEG